MGLKSLSRLLMAIYDKLKKLEAYSQYSALKTSGNFSVLRMHQPLIFRALKFEKKGYKLLRGLFYDGSSIDRSREDIHP